ncbi:MAG: hypothetical protein GTO18_03955 [Anaerolineales bacterium]|nr:hypothetical protein [Anaerolineales bacterium]
MISRKHTQFVLLIAFSLLVLILLTSCGSQEIRSAKPRSDWSRGLRLGFSAGIIPPSLVVDNDGTSNVAWTAETRRLEGILGYAQVSPSGEVISKIEITIPDSHVRGTTLWPQRDELHICWNSDSGFQCSELDPQAPENLQAYQVVSQDTPVISFSGSEQYYAYVTNVGDLYVARIGEKPIKFASQAQHVYVLTNEEHVAINWYASGLTGENLIWYAVGDENGFGPPVLAARYSTGIEAGVRPAGLFAVLDDDELCLFYSLEIRRGFEANTAFTEYGCFDITTEEKTIEGALSLLATDQMEFESYEGPFPLNRLAVLNVPPSDYTHYPSAPVVNENHLAVAVSSPQQTRYRVQQQILLLVLEDGHPIGYQPVTATKGFSTSPTMGADETGNLYLTWIERTSRNEIYFTTTNPSAAPFLNKMELSEISVTILGIMMDTVTGLVMFPLGLVWIAISFAGVGLGYVIGRTFRLGRWGDYLSFILGLIVLWLAKLVFIPQIQTFVPFSTWMPELSSQAIQIWRLFWPVVIVAVSYLISDRLSRRWELESIFLRFGLYAVIDILLSLGVYGVILQGAA